MHCHMTDNLNPSEIEDALKLRGVSVARMCRVAGISQSTWHKMKFQGTRPRESTRRVITQAVDTLLAPRMVDGEKAA